MNDNKKRLISMAQGCLLVIIALIITHIVTSRPLDMAIILGVGTGAAIFIGIRYLFS